MREATHHGVRAASQKCPPTGRDVRDACTVAVSTFFGRDNEREYLLQLVEARPLVTVTGPGGIGKTRLVVESILEDAAVICELASLQVGAGVDAIAAEGGWASPEAAAIRLSKPPKVLVLDNCEHVLD